MASRLTLEAQLRDVDRLLYLLRLMLATPNLDEAIQRAESIRRWIVTQLQEVGDE